MEKAIEIKRRAQRCIQNGDLDGALSEYEKLVGAEDSDPYNFVLLADLLYKKGDQGGAAERYLAAVNAYEKASLYKNAIAVCKKMMRLSLSPAKVLQSLASLHALDGLAGEAALYYVQYAEHMVRTNSPVDAAEALRKAFNVCQDNLKVLEQLSEAWLLAGETAKASETLVEAAGHYRARGMPFDAERCLRRAAQLSRGGAAEPADVPASLVETRDAAETATNGSAPPAHVATPEPGAFALENASEEPAPASARESLPDVQGFESTRHAPATPSAPAPVADVPPEAPDPSHERASDAERDVPVAAVTAMADVTSQPLEPSGSNGAAGAEHVPAAVSEPEPEPAAVAAHAQVPTHETAPPTLRSHEQSLEQDAVAPESSATSFAHEAPQAPASLAAPEAPAARVDPREQPLDAPAGREQPFEDLPTEDVHVYDIQDTDPTVDLAPEPSPEAARPHGGAHGEPAVYEIADEDLAADPAASAAPASAVPVEAGGERIYDIDAQDAGGDEVPSTGGPGLAFGPTHASAPASRLSAEEDAMHRIEGLLAQAHEHFRAGDRDLASQKLALAAGAYEGLGRLESAATIYRSLGSGLQASIELMEHWLANCERRGDLREAARVACELGDRALNDGKETDARAWFERALAFDQTNETAHRRLHKLAGEPAGSGSVAVAAPPAAAAATAQAQAPESAQASGAEDATDPALEHDKVEVAIGRAEAVTFDLEGLLAEFQRGVAAQLAGDAQSHYDLGMTYREMGLLEQAVDSFRVAEADPKLTVRSLEMIGRCYADQGRWKDAVVEFRRAIAHPGAGQDEDSELRFHLGIALSESGDTAAALSEFENVAGHMPNFANVDERIGELRRRMGPA